MPTVRIRPSGTSATATPHRLLRPLPETAHHNRRVNRGWTEAVSRRNTQFLQSLDFERLTDPAYAITLTIPADSIMLVTPARFHGWLNAMLVTARRQGLTGYHWVLEFTAKGTPHLHMSTWWHGERSAVLEALVWRAMVARWLKLLTGDGVKADSAAQVVKPLEGTFAWAMYVAKHSARGVQHYQRQIANMPAGWEAPGAMWGHSRGLPTREELWTADFHAFWTYRRRCRAWCRAQAATSPAVADRGRAIAASRRMLRCSDRDMSPMRGVGVWVPEGVSRRVMASIDGVNRVETVSREEYERRLTACETAHERLEFERTTKAVG